MNAVKKNNPKNQEKCFFKLHERPLDTVEIFFLVISEKQSMIAYLFQKEKKTEDLVKAGLEVSLFLLGF